MIQANELRIGNWVRTIYPINKEPFQVYPMAFRQLGKGDVFDTWEPIQLIEEWLVRFGFEKDKMFFEFSIHTIRINIVLFPISPKNKEYQVRINNSTTQIFIQYVHQLQNLYFSLTGLELELNEKD